MVRFLVISTLCFGCLSANATDLLAQSFGTFSSGQALALGTSRKLVSAQVGKYALEDGVMVVETNAPESIVKWIHEGMPSIDSFELGAGGKAQAKIVGLSGSRTTVEIDGKVCMVMDYPLRGVKTKTVDLPYVEVQGFIASRGVSSPNLGIGKYNVLELLGKLGAIEKELRPQIIEYRKGQPIDETSREWVSGDFKTIATLIGFESGEVALKLKDGRMVDVPLARLDDDSRKYVRERVREINNQPTKVRLVAIN